MHLFDRYAQWGYPQERLIHLPQVIRINTLVVDEDVCVNALKELNFTVRKTDLPLAYEIAGELAITTTLPYLSGWVYLQELASQVVIHALDTVPESVVDLAAAPGSKTTQMSAFMQNKGAIYAMDTSHDRLMSLQSNCSRMGVHNVVAYQIDATFADSIAKGVDVVLCDVPCSGNFTQQHWDRSLEDIKSRVAMQKQLLQTATMCVKEGGYILYSTCSLEIEENEEVVEWALDQFSLELEPVDIGLGHTGLTERTKKCLRLWPTQDKTGGFFIAKLKLV